MGFAHNHPMNGGGKRLLAAIVLNSLIISLSDVIIGRVGVEETRTAGCLTPVVFARGAA